MIRQWHGKRCSLRDSAKSCTGAISFAQHRSAHQIPSSRAICSISNRSEWSIPQMLTAASSRRSIHVQRGAQWSRTLQKSFHHASSHAARLAPPPPIWAPLRPGACRWVKLPTQGTYHCSRRCIHIPPVVYLAPLTFGGLLVALYVWKCFMLVAFQNKIIYMPGFPPNARSERIVDYAGRQCGDVDWANERTKAADGTDLAMAVATVPLPRGSRLAEAPTHGHPKAHVYVLYFQGNASSIPPRLPGISWVLRAVSDNRTIDLSPTQLTFVCLSYRGFWTSRGRPSEKGLRLDAEAGVEWISRYHKHKQKYGNGSDVPVPVLLVWGQSIGCGVATNLAATGRLPADMPISGLLLETPFLSVKAMLEALYPQKWLPYKRLWPFLRNHLDSESNLDLIARSCKENGREVPFVHILEAERDEIVPKEHGDVLYQKCIDLGVPVLRETIPVAFHNEAIARGDGKKLAANAILGLTKRALNRD